MNLDDKLIYTVSRINGEIKTVLEDSYPAVWITGEISNFKTYSSGHSYFVLKDENSQLSAVLFAGYGRNLKFRPRDGMQVVVYGKITAYVQKGAYQVQVAFMEETGKGTLQEAFEFLKNKLQNEGLFDETKKKRLPFFMSKIGIVTSGDGAALHDILKILGRVKTNIEILIYPVKVQGDQAKYEIARAIEYLNAAHKDLDVLLVGRGGGSLEDLWAFNEEIVTRAVFASEIPVISCVGHEVDYTITDFTADVRAATPSVAAEIIVSSRTEIENALESYGNRIKEIIARVLKFAGEKIDSFKKSRALSKPHLIYEDKIQYVDELGFRIRRKIKEISALKQSELELNVQKLNLLSPLNVLAKGYSVCFDGKNPVKRAAALNYGDSVEIKFFDGSANAEIKEVSHEKK